VKRLSHGFAEVRKNNDLFWALWKKARKSRGKMHIVALEKRTCEKLEMRE
jgi:hypothetical protein